MTGIFRTSEFWMGLAAVFGQVGAALGFWKQEDYNAVLLPALVYIGGRVASKIAKAKIKPPPAVLGLAVALLLVPALAAGQTAPPPAKVFGLALGAHGVWYDNAAADVVSEVEAGLHARASLSPHISVVGSADYGFRAEYFTAAIGPRITATDTKDRTFSIGVGIQYRYYSDEYETKEWQPDVSIGWRPWADLPNVIITGTGAYGLDTEEARATVGARYRLF
jgi:hypothetical protein